jgi:LmbE family N-acetylglucosaminyl deacetylase
MNKLFGNKILVIAAHPDDEVLGVGGTIPLLKRQHASIDLVIATDGSSTQYTGDEKLLKQKFFEASEAARILGIDNVIKFSFPDMRLDTVAHADINKEFESLIKSNNYDTVFVQDKGDINMDHKQLFHSALVACRPHPHQSVKSLFSYYVNSSSEWGGLESTRLFSPNVYIDITETIELKLKAMEAYKTELRSYPHPRSIRAIKTSAEYFGNHVGYEFAEPFKLIFSR